MQFKNRENLIFIKKHGTFSEQPQHFRAMTVKITIKKAAPWAAFFIRSYVLKNRLFTQLKNCCSTHTATDTHGLNTIPNTASLHIGYQGSQQFGTGTSQRMAKSNGAAIDIDNFIRAVGMPSIFCHTAQSAARSKWPGKQMLH